MLLNDFFDGVTVCLMFTANLFPELFSRNMGKYFFEGENQYESYFVEVIVRAFG